MTQSETTSAAGGGETYPTGTAQRLIQRLEDATAGGSMFGCRADYEEAVEIAAEEITAALAAPTAKGGTDPLVAYLERQWSWSKETFGPALRTKGIVQHITKELREIEADPHDLAEWVDVIILAMDGFWRHGGKPSDLLPAMQAKQDRNFARTWPDWRTMGEDQAIEHDRSGEASPPPPAGAAGGGSGDLGALSAEAVAAAYYNCMIGDPKEFWPHHDGWAGKSEAFKAKVRDRMAKALKIAALSAPTPDRAVQVEPVASAVEVEAAAKRLYDKHTDDAGIHSNRFPSWRELSEEGRAEWRAKVPALTPDLGAQGEPVAWAYEYRTSGKWDVEVTRVNPQEWAIRPEYVRNIRPLYEAPAAPRTGSGVSVEEAREAFFTFLCRKYVQRADARQKSMGLQYTEAETHDLAKEVARFALALFAPTPPSGVETIRQDNTSGGL